MSNPFDGLKTVDEGQKKEWLGWKLRINLNTSNLITYTEARYKSVEVLPLLDLESNLEKVGPHGHPVKKTWKEEYYEILPSGEAVPIPRNAIKYMQEIDGEKVPVSKLGKTEQVDISEGRAIEECTLTGDFGKNSLGTLITREDVDKYATSSVYTIFSDRQESALKTIADYLEKQRLALFFPFSHGNGFKIYTATAFPVRRNGQLFFLLLLHTGEMVFTKPILASEKPVEEKVRQLAMPKLATKRKPAGVA